MQILHDIVKLKAKVEEVPIVFNEREREKVKLMLRINLNRFMLFCVWV